MLLVLLLHCYSTLRLFCSREASGTVTGQARRYSRSWYNPSPKRMGRMPKIPTGESCTRLMADREILPGKMASASAVLLLTSKPRTDVLDSTVVTIR
ncbi:hypothetical protein F5X98DRAFT_141506 [Xylaria grammica]|nr:hypothetical protein F5X98DRAFT_141506 [Xylaria grammica]